MGSRISRALSQTDRHRRIPQSSQNQARMFIKYMCTGLMFVLVFFIGFLASHSSYTHRHWSQFITLGIITSIIINATNPQITLISGWIILSFQSLFVNGKVPLLYNFGAHMVITAAANSFYHYFAGAKAQINSQSKVRFIVPVVQLLVIGTLLKLAHCFSDFVKQLNQNNKNVTIQQQHHLGIRALFCVMGTMMAMLSIMGHSYVRNSRFLPLAPKLQIKYWYNLDRNTKLQFLFSYNHPQMSICTQRLTYFIQLLAVAVFLTGFSILLSLFMQKYKKQSYLLILVIISSILSPIFKFVPKQFYPSCVLLSVLAPFVYFSQVITDKYRATYIFSIIVALIMQSSQVRSIQITTQYSVSVMLTLLPVFSSFCLFFLYRCGQGQREDYLHLNNGVTRGGSPQGDE